jgi:hypothetical protein
MPVVFYDIKLAPFEALPMLNSMNRQIQSLKHFIKYLKEFSPRSCGYPNQQNPADNQLQGRNR